MSLDALLRSRYWLLLPVVAVAVLVFGLTRGRPNASPPTPTAEPTTVATANSAATVQTPATQTSATQASGQEPESEPAVTPSDEPAPSPEPSATSDGVGAEPTPPGTGLLGDPTSVPAAETAELRAAAVRALEDGEYARAASLLEPALSGWEGAARAELQVLLARAYYDDERYDRAIATLAETDLSALSSAWLTQALGYLARSYEGQGAWSYAVNAYTRMLEEDTSAEHRVRWELARAHKALGRDAEAKGQLEAIVLDGLPASRRAEILEELGGTRLRLGDADGAIAAYDGILAFAEQAPYRAQIMQKQGEALMRADRYEEAAQAYRRAVSEHPFTAGAVSSLQALDMLGVAEVNDLLRGQVLYQGGQYQGAAEVLERYLQDDEAVSRDRAYHYIGLSRQQLGDVDGAIAAWDALITHQADSSLLADAWLAKGRALEARGDDVAAFYDLFSSTFADHPRAAEMLWRAADGLERARYWDRASALYQALYTRYPQDSRAVEARFRDGLAAYVSGDVGAAYNRLGELLPLVSGAESARVLTWLGLCAQKGGFEADARGLWEQAVQAAPNDYYGFRARDLLDGATPHLAPDVGALVPSSQLTEGDWQDLRAWVRTWSSAEGAQVASARQVQQATALWDLGWHTEATSIFSTYRATIQDNPMALVELAQWTHARDVTPVAIWAAERIMVLARPAGVELPDPLLRLAYPTSYGHLVAAESHARAMDPLLFLALIRQESRFDPRAVSWAGATGLGQVMPATGEWIAERVGTPNYRRALLTRPVISVEYGVWFMAWLLDRYDRDWVASLAAYNGGPGNVDRWTGGRPIEDHDLFYELTPLAETKSYIRLVYANYRMYERLYR